MNLIYYCLYIYLFLKPFYVLKSGSMQPADFFLVIGFLLLFILRNKEDKIKSIVNQNRKFLIFVLLVFFINGIYFVLYLKLKFILSSLYFLFNFFAIVLFSFAFCDEKVTKNLCLILKVDILIQLIIFLLGLGRWYGSVRYMGTFNDPNQFGYFILMSYMFIYLISLKYNIKKGVLLFLFISIFLIIECASTGMLLAIFLFLFLQFIDIIKNFYLFFRKNAVKIVVCSIILIPILVIFLIYNTDYHFVNLDNFAVFSRVSEKFKKADVKESGSDVSLIQERGYDRFIYYPQYILFGSGEGDYDRFTLTYHRNEIHATFPSILFYYGIIPTLILLSWVYDKIKNATINSFIPLVAIFIESFTLLNQRQVLFWIIILFVSTIQKNEKIED